MNQEKLDHLVRIEKLQSEPSDDDEVSSLVSLGKTRLEDAENTQLHIESRFDLSLQRIPLTSAGCVEKMWI